MSRPADRATAIRGALALVAGLAALGVALAAPAAATPWPDESWAAELALDGGDDRGVALVDRAVRLAATPDDPTVGELGVAPRRTRGVFDSLAARPTADTPAGSSVVVE